MRRSDEHEYTQYVVLRFYCDLSIAETAAALGCNEGTVKSLTSRGLESLRELATEEQR